MRLVITFQGLLQLLADLRGRGIVPAALLLSPNDKRDLKWEIIGSSKKHTKDAEEWDHDLRTVAFIGGVPVMSHKDVKPGTARIIEKQVARDRNRDIIVQ